MVTNFEIKKISWSQYIKKKKNIVEWKKKNSYGMVDCHTIKFLKNKNCYSSW